MALTEKSGLRRIHYAGLNAELGLPMLDRNVSHSLGVRLWLLKDPTVTWTDFAVALYNLHTDETDSALIDLKVTYLPNTGLFVTLPMIMYMWYSKNMYYVQ